MRLTFRQGIITYPISGNLQSFLVSSGIYVTLYAANGRIDLAFAHGIEDYLLTETNTVPDAWGPLPSSTNCWLYWDIDKRTAIRTFGFTTVEPVYGEAPPLLPASDQHWFDTVDQVMYVYTAGQFREVIRVFAAKFNNSTFTPIGYGSAQRPYAGTQVSIVTSVNAGRILIDDLGNPVRRSNGHFFTTEHDFFVDGSPINILRLESTVLTGTAKFENLSAYQVVVFSAFGEIGHATYSDIQSAAVAILLEDLNRYDTGTVCLQGHITNPAWNWSTVGAPLWINDTGALVEIDPHVSAPLTYQTGKSPVARVIAQNSIMFDQGLGGKGDTGARGPLVGPASDTSLGTIRLTLAAANVLDPIVPGTNDPRLSDARVPLAHTQGATTIIPTPYGTLTGANLQLVLQQIEDGKLAKSGGTMTGTLVLSGAPTSNLHAATKQYVDSSKTSEPLTQVVYGTGDGVDSSPTFRYDHTVGLFSVEPIPNAAPQDIRLLSAATLSGLSSQPGGGLTLYAGDANNTLGGGGAMNAGAGWSVGGTGGPTYIEAGSSATGSGGALYLSAGGTSSNIGGLGGNAYLEAGHASGSNGKGGAVFIRGGAVNAVSAGYSGGVPAGMGGDISILAGFTNSENGDSGGQVIISGGDALGYTGTGGAVSINGGHGEATGSNVVITAGKQASPSHNSHGVVTLSVFVAGSAVSKYNVTLHSINGALQLAAHPLGPFDASTKQYVDTSIANIFSSNNVFTASQRVAPITLIDGLTIGVNAALSNNFRVTLGGNRTLSNPTNLADGMVINMVIKQDLTGGRLLTFGSAYDFGAAGAPILSTAGSTLDFVSCYYDATASVMLCNFRKGLVGVADVPV